MIKQPYEKHGICTKEPCGKCIYRALIGLNYSCDYIGYTGKMRPCPAGKGCTAFESGTPLSQRKAPTIPSKQIKICEICKKNYPGGAKQKFCPECYRKRQNEINRMKAKERAQQKHEEELSKPKFCKACGVEYRSHSERIEYCEACRKLTKTKRRRMRDNLCGSI